MDNVTLPNNVAEAPNSLMQEIDNEQALNSPVDETASNEEWEDIDEEISEEEVVSEEEIAEPEHQEIPTNSDTLLIDETASRFSSAIWAEKIREKRILLAGVGGIGSYVAFLLSRLKPNVIDMFDPDIVESGNMSGQLYGRSHLGKNKVGAISEVIGEFSNYYSVQARCSRYNVNSPSTDIMICGFDNMSARKVFYNKWKTNLLTLDEEQKKKSLFIDGRLAAEEFQVFCIKGDDVYHMKDYEEKWLFNDEEAEATVCSYKQTSHCANMIASIMVNLLVNHIANECEPLIDRDVPYLTTYDATTMYFKTVS